MENVKTIIKNCIDKIHNIITNNATHIIIENDNQSIQYDAPNSINYAMFTNKSEIGEVKKNTININLEPIYIKYVINRDSFEYANKASNITFTPFYNNIREMFTKYQYQEQNILLYNENNISNIQPLIPNISTQYTIKKENINTNQLHEEMLKMKNYMIQKHYINNSIWIVSSATYQLLQNVQLSLNNDWQEKFYGLPIYICNELKEQDLAILINLKESYCVLTKPSYNIINIDTNTLKHNDGYEIDITLYIGSYILNKESGVILKYTDK